MLLSVHSWVHSPQCSMSVLGEYLNIFGYLNICLKIFDIRIRILEILLIEYIHIRIRSKLSFVKGEYPNIFGYLNICLQILDIRIQILEIGLGQKINTRPTLTQYCCYVYKQKKLGAYTYVDRLRNQLMGLYVKNQRSQNVLAHTILIAIL